MGLFARAAMKGLSGFDQGVGTLAAGRHIGQLGSGRTATGVSVTTDSALGFSGFFAAVRVLSESLAQVPLLVYERIDDGKGNTAKRRAYEHPLYPVLHDRANPEMVAFQARETGMAHICCVGNSYAQKLVDATGKVRGIYPLRPERMVDIDRAEGGEQLATGWGLRAAVRGELVYSYQVDAADGGGIVQAGRDAIFHVPGLAWDGIRGYSFLRVAREALALGITAQEFAGRFLANDARPDIVVTHPKTLSDTAKTNVTTSWAEQHQGTKNAGGFAILEEDMKVTVLGVSPEDGQLLETRKFQIEEMARVFRLPPHMLADLEHATFSNIEEQALEFVTYALTPWAVRWEQHIGMQLLGDDWVGNGGRFFVEFLFDALVRGNLAARYAAYHQARIDGWLNADEIRDRENLNRLPDGQGQGYWRPLNTTTTAPDGTVTTTTLDTGSAATGGPA